MWFLVFRLCFFKTQILSKGNFGHFRQCTCPKFWRPLLCIFPRCWHWCNISFPELLLCRVENDNNWFLIQRDTAGGGDSVGGLAPWFGVPHWGGWRDGSSMYAMHGSKGEWVLRTWSGGPCTIWPFPYCPLDLNFHPRCRDTGWKELQTQGEAIQDFDFPNLAGSTQLYFHQVNISAHSRNRRCSWIIGDASQQVEGTSWASVAISWPWVTKTHGHMLVLLLNTL